MKTIAAKLRPIVGSDGVLDEPGEMTKYRGDLGCPVGGQVICVVRPRTALELSRAVTLCAEAGVALTPRGGGTGLSGGATPAPGTSTIVISFEHMRRIRSVDPIGNVIIAEAGCTLGEVQHAATTCGRLLGLDHGATGSSQIGGTLSSNAGGNNVLRYGMARDQVLGLEVVLADGCILTDLSSLRKNNAGYDLKQVFLGAEGTLGLITAAALRLRPAPVVRVTACLGLQSIEAALELFTLAQADLGDAISAFELMPREGLALHFSRVGAVREPLQRATPWLVLIEADSVSRYFELSRAIETLLAAALEIGIVSDGTIAATEAQRLALWRIREGIAVAMIETPGSLKSDTAVPIAAIPDFVARARTAVEAIVPGCVPVPFGHIGDGNIHFSVLSPADMRAEEFCARWPDLTHAIEDIALALGGTVSAEHGIGLLKRDALQRMRSPTAIDLMKSLKAALDPHHILNPGKIWLD